MTKISTDIQSRVATIEGELNALLKERADVVHGMLVARVAQQHLLMLGPGGTGKSLLVREWANRITGSTHFETALDETTDPGMVFGPPDIKAMVEDGKTRRVTTGMLPEATDAFVDEFFNGNAPVLHGLQPIMNERLFHNNGIPARVPLRSMYAGTNKLNADADLAALFDRLHLRYQVDYIRSRENMTAMVTEAIGRMVAGGRAALSVVDTKTVVTLDELDVAHRESLELDVDDAVMALFLDIRQELAGNGVIISDRRTVEGALAVLANAWVRGHSSVRGTDLDILASMWWVVQDQIPTTRNIILSVTNPGEKAALELLDQLDKIVATCKEAEQSQDGPRKQRVGVEAVKNLGKLVAEAEGHKKTAVAAGSGHTKLDEVIQRSEDFKIAIAKDIFNLSPETLARMRAADQ